MTSTSCRFCGARVEAVFADLGMSPFANSYLPPERADSMEPFYPLHARVCRGVLPGAARIIRNGGTHLPEYAYFSTYSPSGSPTRTTSRHGRAVRPRPSQSRVVEIASNDGYLLQYFTNARSRCWGSSPPPTSPPSHEASPRGYSSARQRPVAPAASARRPDFGNNVLAHVPTSTTSSPAKILLKPDGVLTFEFPHLCG